MLFNVIQRIHQFIHILSYRDIQISVRLACGQCLVFIVRLGPTCLHVFSVYYVALVPWWRDGRTRSNKNAVFLQGSSDLFRAVLK